MEGSMNGIEWMSHCRSHLAQAGIYSAEAVIRLQQQQQRPGDTPEHVSDRLCILGGILLKLPPARFRGWQIQVIH